MKYKKLKPILTGSVFLLPALLLLSGEARETNAMMRGALSKLPTINRMNLPNMPKLNTPTMVKPTFNTKLNQMKLPSVVNKVDVSASKPTMSFNKSYSLKNGSTLRMPIIKSNSFGGKLNTASKGQLKPQGSITTQANSQAPELKPRQPLNNNNNNFQKLDPGYDTVPKPIFTPKNPSKPMPEPEVYENVVILNTNAGTLTIFKD